MNTWCSPCPLGPTFNVSCLMPSVGEEKHGSFVFLFAILLGAYVILLTSFSGWKRSIANPFCVGTLFESQTSKLIWHSIVRDCTGEKYYDTGQAGVLVDSWLRKLQLNWGACVWVIASPSTNVPPPPQSFRKRESEQCLVSGSIFSKPFPA